MLLTSILGLLLPINTLPSKESNLKITVLKNPQSEHVLLKG